MNSKDTELKTFGSNGRVIDEEAKEGLTKAAKKDDDPLGAVLAHVGEMGRYQWLLFVTMMPGGFSMAFVYFVQMFVVATPQKHWCRVPELAGLDMELRRNLSAPGAALGGDWDKCMTFEANWTRVLETLTPPDTGTPLVPCSHGWEFELGDIPYHTVVSEAGFTVSQAGTTHSDPGLQCSEACTTTDLDKGPVQTRTTLPPPCCMATCCLNFEVPRSQATLWT